jgi:SAM-dependent methyltransferase
LGIRRGHHWLACPLCHGALDVNEYELLCVPCDRSYPILDGVPQMVLDETLDAAAVDAIDAWDELAEDYAAFVEGLGAARLGPIDRPLIGLARGDVLEVGCGDGRLLAQIAGVGSLVGVDLSPEMTARAGARGFAVATAAAERLPLRDRSVDTVLSGFYSMRYVDLDAALPEVARVLRPGGRFGFTLQGRWSVGLAGRAAGLRLLGRRGQWRQAARLLLGREEGVVLPTDVASLEELRGRLASHGLDARVVLGTPYLPGLTTRLARWSGGRLPYLRGALAARLGRDVIVLGRRAGERVD